MTIAEALKWAEERLERVGISFPKRESELLLSSFLKVEISEILLNPYQSVSNEREFRKWVARRCCREPLQYITCRADFYGLTFKIKRGVFIPRPETELVVEEALKLFEGGSILDLGTGCGNIVLSILKRTAFSKSVGIGVDISEKALAVAKENALTLGLGDRVLFLKSNWGEDLKGWFSFDLIVSNPPYIPRDVLGTLDPEITLYEPLEAILESEGDFSFYARTLDISKDLLKEGGKVVVEIGDEEVLDFLSENDEFALVSVRNDYSGKKRVAIFQRK